MNDEAKRTGDLLDVLFACKNAIDEMRMHGVNDAVALRWVLHVRDQVVLIERLRSERVFRDNPPNFYSLSETLKTVKAHSI